MFKKTLLALIGLAILAVNAQNYDLEGVVSNSSGEPIADAVVSLVGIGISDTTDADGKFAFIGTSTKRVPAFVPQANNISFKNNVLQFSISESAPMKIQIFNLKGSLLGQQMKMNATAGTHNFDISKYYHSANVLLVKASIGNSEATFRCIPFSSWGYALNRVKTESNFSNSQSFTAADEAVDTIKVTATGYKPKSVPITSLGDKDISITLKANNEKDDPTPSCGCGKPLEKINKSGTYNITSAGRNRSFIIDIPQNYDKDKPYRLIFGMHCMGSSAQGTVGENYYNLKSQAEKAGIQCIFVAPQGNSNGTWGEEYEHTFVVDMLTLFKENLCIDTSRIFSCGFSFGAMFTYSLSLSFQNDLRAVATYAPANYNIWLPTNKKLPIAYLQISGTGDNTCPWVNNEEAKRGGKFCVLSHAEDNGCTIPGNIPTGGGQRATTEFEGCKDGYPVRVIVHSGGHDWQMVEQGTKYAPIETWDFFMRF